MVCQKKRIDNQKSDKSQTVMKKVTPHAKIGFPINIGKSHPWCEPPTHGGAKEIMDATMIIYKKRKEEVFLGPHLKIWRYKSPVLGQRPLIVMPVNQNEVTPTLIYHQPMRSNRDE